MCPTTASFDIFRDHFSLGMRNTDPRKWKSVKFGDSSDLTASGNCSIFIHKDAHDEVDLDVPPDLQVAGGMVALYGCFIAGTYHGRAATQRQSTTALTISGSGIRADRLGAADL